MKKIVLTLLLTLSLTLVVAPAEKAEAQKKIPIRATQCFAASHPWQKGMEAFKEVIEKDSNGAIKVEIYAAGQLSGGNIRTMCEQVQAGTLHLLVQSPLGWAGLVPKSQVYNLPFMFPSNEVGMKMVSESEASKKALQKIFGGTGVDYMGVWANGYRQITSSKSIVHKPEDMAGWKVRVPPAPILMDIFKELGTLPVAISTPEIYTALQQGTVDAQENPISAIASNKLYEVAPYITLWEYCWDPGMVTINSKFFAGLSDEHKKMVEHAITEAGKVVNALITKEDNDFLKVFEESGSTVYKMTPEENNLFKEKMKPIYDKYVPEFGEDVYQTIITEIAAAEEALKK